MKAIIDSSVLVSAFLTRDGASGLVVKAGLDRRFEMHVSDLILAETNRRLRNRPKLSDRYGYNDDDVTHYISDLAAGITVLTNLPHHRTGVPRPRRRPCDRCGPGRYRGLHHHRRS